MNKQIRLTTICLTAALIFCAVATTVTAQVATGGSYTLNQSVIASGGGQNSTGGNFTVDGTIGQTAAGTRSTNAPFSVAGGFWTTDPLAPSAASVSVSGRILAPDGIGLRNARVVLTASSGEIRTAISSSFGYYQFTEVAVGETYIISVVSKRFFFVPQVISVGEEIQELDLVAVSENLQPNLNQ